MASRYFDASRTINGTDANTDSSNRIAQLRQLYFIEYTNLQSSAFGSYAGLDACQCGGVMEELASGLHKYRGPLDDGGASFEKWSSRHVAKEAQRYRLLMECMTTYRRGIYDAIHRI